MRGEFIKVWPEMWMHVWRNLATHKNAPDDLFCELFRELETTFINRLDPATNLADIVDDPEQAEQEFRAVMAESIVGETSLIGFLERTSYILNDLGGDSLANSYFLLVESFIEKFSLRYDLRRPFSLHPTISGLFSRLVIDLRDATDREPNLRMMLKEFEDAVRDLRNDQSSGKIKTCIHKQMNLLEALTQRCSGVTAKTLGSMCDEVTSWPHVTIKEAMKKLYGFSSDYPGIRHAGNPSSAAREIEMRDMIALTVMLTGFTPYLSDQLNPSQIYGGVKP